MATTLTAGNCLKAFKNLEVRQGRVQGAALRFRQTPEFTRLRRCKVSRRLVVRATGGGAAAGESSEKNSRAGHFTNLEQAVELPKRLGLQLARQFLAFGSLLKQWVRRITGQFQSREQSHRHVRKITDKVFQNFTAGSGEDKLSFQELYTAILLVYNDINKHVPGSHRDPPSRKEVQKLIQEFDVNENGYLDREEFAAFLQRFTKNVSKGITKSLIVCTVAPLLAFLAKWGTEELPKVGPVVRRIPNALYAILVSTAIAILGHQKAIED